MDANVGLIGVVVPQEVGSVLVLKIFGIAAALSASFFLVLVASVGYNRQVYACEICTCYLTIPFPSNYIASI
jgi:hypothetical protein